MIIFKYNVSSVFLYFVLLVFNNTFAGIIKYRYPWTKEMNLAFGLGATRHSTDRSWFSNINFKFEGSRIFENYCLGFYTNAIFANHINPLQPLLNQSLDIEGSRRCYQFIALIKLGICNLIYDSRDEFISNGKKIFQYFVGDPGLMISNILFGFIYENISINDEAQPSKNLLSATSIGNAVVGCGIKIYSNSFRSCSFIAGTNILLPVNHYGYLHYKDKSKYAIHKNSSAYILVYFGVGSYVNKGFYIYVGSNIFWSVKSWDEESMKVIYKKIMEFKNISMSLDMIYTA